MKEKTQKPVVTPTPAATPPDPILQRLDVLIALMRAQSDALAPLIRRMSR